MANESIRRKEMIEKKLDAELRTSDFGTRGSRRLLRSGRIPAVVYGKNEPLHVTVDARTFNNNRKGYGESTLITLNVKGEKEHEVFVKTFQEDLLRNVIHHIDFYEVTRGQTVRTHVRIELEGTAAGVKEGGVLDQVIHEVEIECLPKDLPEILTLDVSALKMNESLKLSDIKLAEGVKIHGDLDETVATVKPVKVEAAPAAEEAADAAAPADAATAETK